MSSNFRYNTTFDEYLKIWRANVTDELVSKFFIKFTYYSIKIYDKNLLLHDINSIFISETFSNPKIKSSILCRIKNYKEIYEMFFKLSKTNKTKLSIELIKCFYDILTKNIFTKDTIKKKTLAETYTENSLILLINNINLQKSNVNELNIISKFYCLFFKYSSHLQYCNQELYKVFINYLLISKNIPPIFFSDKHAEKYFFAVSNFNKKKDTSKMYEFLKEEIFTTWISNYNLRLKKLNDILIE
ncbi:hypothetical protein [Clostridium hydrogenum]|uniref:hypothetical protein n=1 Tax=Clostridium hydrogenum TaxID=2855764 RepID=UPI001F178D1F|nr:hypothetical protein [Clostridium hydrogenum]